MMKRLAFTSVLLVTLAGCTSMDRLVDRVQHGSNPYLEEPFYGRYMDPANPTDREILTRVDALRQSPDSAPLHNELGSLLLHRRFPKDAEIEFRRATFSDPDFYPAWYNLALVRLSRDDVAGADQALRRTLDLRPGHAQAHFQLGLIEEQRGRRERAVNHYAQAFTINRALLDVRVNPQILDSELVDLALLKLYPTSHITHSIRFQNAPQGYRQDDVSSDASAGAPSPQALPEDIVTPAPPVTDPGAQPSVPPSE